MQQLSIVLFISVYSPSSPVSPDEPDSTAFQREALGRRSMSEKRKGHVDPKMSEFYQKIKENREKGQQYYSG